MSMNYSELVNAVEKNRYLETRFDVVAYLIGYNGGLLTEEDFDNIQRLYLDHFIRG